VIKYQPTNQKDDDSIINEISVFTFAIVKTESKLNCKKRDTCPLAQCDDDFSWYRKGCRQLLRVIKKKLGWLPTLIKWRKLPAEDSTWEDESFRQKHPYLLKHCGQHLSQGEGHVKP
jgi:hypothetical protein